MNRIEFFENVLNRCEQAFEQDPNWIPLEWIIDQLNYLIALEQGVSTDFSRLKRIKIGWIAVRELDGFEDKKLIDDLCLIAKEIETIKKEKCYE